MKCEQIHDMSLPGLDKKSQCMMPQPLSDPALDRDGSLAEIRADWITEPPHGVLLLRIQWTLPCCAKPLKLWGCDHSVT